MKKLCLNMIVRNEAERIIRCLRTVAPYISCAVIFDTGSKDKTPELMAEYFTKVNIPFTIKHGEFKNFEQARNDALELARRSDFVYDYILFADADMILHVEDKNFRDNLHLPTYGVTQKGGSISYNNIRLVRRDVTGKYRGVTHEYFDVPQAAVLPGVWYQDLADGSNRKNKFLRDILLLKEGLAAEPEFDRYWYYLGQSYRDAGMMAEAAEAYKKRMGMGGWDEEVWNAKDNYANCLKDLGDEDGYIAGKLEAFNTRPTRVEPLYDLAKFFRDRGKSHVALLLLKQAMTIPRPADSLFVNDFIYNEGLRQEFAISAYYSEKDRPEGLKVANALATDKKVWASTRDHARDTIFWYLNSLKHYCPSFDAKRFEVPSEGWKNLNPSITNHGDQLVCIFRTVNYTIDENGVYNINGVGPHISDENPIRTRNYLTRLNPDTFAIETCKEIVHPVDMPPPAFKSVLGFEDMRLISWKGSLWASSTVRELNPDGWCEQVLTHLSEEGHGVTLDRLKVMLPPVRATEKNWMPFVDKHKNLRFVYRLDTLVDDNGKTVKKFDVPFAIDNISGGSQVVPFNDGWIAIVHEARIKPGSSKRHYYHRFVFWDHGFNSVIMTLPFCLHQPQIEFVAGLAWNKDKTKLLLSYAIDDKEAWIGSVDKLDVQEMLWQPHA